MTDFIRRLVSGNKSRFKDGALNMELDLVYVTDQLIIMGYPASGIEGLYRNRREDAQKFLAHRHGQNFWVFNFCPVKENSYPSTVFDGRVSRYPFPDHHAPPLAILPLAAREMHHWLRESPDRVIVLHCKAGKGRSGTLACTYLLSLDNSPQPPKLERSYNSKQWAKLRAEELMKIMPDDDTAVDLGESSRPILEVDANDSPPTNSEIKDSGLLSQGIMAEASRPASPQPSTGSNTSPKVTPIAFSGPLQNVLDLHTSRRMKTLPDAKVKQGVSIPSQRRWLYYWSLLLTHQGPADFWPSPVSQEAKKLRPKVRLTEIKIRMKEMSGVKMSLLKAANLVLDKTNMGKGPAAGKADEQGHVWVSLARYDDEFVETLEAWEIRTRDNTHMGRRKSQTKSGEQKELEELFADSKWDSGKMVRSFARLGMTGESAVKKENSEKDGPISSYTLRPLSDDKWENIREDMQEPPAADAENAIPSETNSIADVTQTLNNDNGIIVDANREVRVKLYMGQVFMGWLWFIPTFHMPHPLMLQGTTRMLLTRKEVDFPLGIGAFILDVEISLEACQSTDVVQPPARQTSEESREDGSHEPGGLAATAQAVAAGGLKDAVEAKQAAED